MTQQALRSQHDEWLPPTPFHLPPQNVKILRWSAGTDNLQVAFRSQAEPAFELGTGMLWALPFEAVRQQKYQATQPPPFVFGTHHELIDDHLPAIDEVAVLSLPGNERLGIVQAISVLKPDVARFAEWTIDHGDRSLPIREMLEDFIFAPILDIVQNCVPMAERPTGGILTGNPHRMSFRRQCGNCQGFGRRPIDWLIPFGHLPPTLDALF